MAKLNVKIIAYSSVRRLEISMVNFQNHAEISGAVYSLSVMK